METFLFILIVLSIFSVAYSIAGIAIDYTDDFDDETMKPSRILPKDLYERTSMNMIGCTFVSIFLFIGLPVLWIYRLFYVLFHIKRK